MILVTGATGHVGGEVVRRLAKRGLNVSAMVRDANAATACRRLPASMPLRVADYDDIPALRTAFEGVDVLVLISSDGAASAVRRHHANTIEAAAEVGVGHIVFTSILDTSELSPFYFSSVYRDADRRLAHCGVPSTVLACGVYSEFVLDSWLLPCATSEELALPASYGQFAPISRNEFAAAVATVATRPTRFAEIYIFTGDRLLDFEDICDIYSEASGKPLRYRSCSIEEYVAAASTRIDEPWPRAFASLCASIGEGRYNFTTRNFAAVVRRKPESFRDFLLRTITPDAQDGIAES